MASSTVDRNHKNSHKVVATTPALQRTLDPIRGGVGKRKESFMAGGSAAGSNSLSIPMSGGAGLLD